MYTTSVYSEVFSLNIDSLKII